MFRGVRCVPGSLLVLSRFLAVLGVLWKRCKQSIPKPCQNQKEKPWGSKIMENGIQIHTTSINNCPLDVQVGKESPAKRDKGGPSLRKGYHFGTTWPIWAPFRLSRVPKESQKRTFWHQGDSKGATRHPKNDTKIDIGKAAKLMPK